jgi:predicted alpha/beta hydrolase family esterase
MVEDGCTLFDWLAALGQVDSRRIAVVGRSLGSGVAVQVAKERAAHSVVLITPYDSILAIAKRKFRAMPIEYMLRHRFESIKHAPSLKVPTYVLRAESDDIVPHSHTDQLCQKLANLMLDDIVPGSDHMNIPYLEATQEPHRRLPQRTLQRAPAAAPAHPNCGLMEKNAESCRHLYFHRINCQVKSYLPGSRELMHIWQLELPLCHAAAHDRSPPWKLAVAMARHPRPHRLQTRAPIQIVTA